MLPPPGADASSPPPPGRGIRARAARVDAPHPARGDVAPGSVADRGAPGREEALGTARRGARRRRARGRVFARDRPAAARRGARALARGPLAPRPSPRFVVVARAERGDARDGDDARAEGDDVRAEEATLPRTPVPTPPPPPPLPPPPLPPPSSTTSSLGWSDVGPGLVPSVATACLGAFLFGYHSAVINAPLSAISEDLGFAGDNVRKGVVVSVLVAGGFLGGLGIGPFADKEGRRAALAATTVPLAAGTLISAGADSFEAMTLGRLITGVASARARRSCPSTYPR